MSRTHAVISKSYARAMMGSYIEIQLGDWVVLKLGDWVQANVERDGPVELLGGETYLVESVRPGYGEAFVKLRGFGENRFPSHLFERAPGGRA